MKLTGVIATKEETLELFEKLHTARNTPAIIVSRQSKEDEATKAWKRAIEC